MSHSRTSPPPLAETGFFEPGSSYQGSLENLLSVCAYDRTKGISNEKFYSRQLCMPKVSILPQHPILLLHRNSLHLGVSNNLWLSCSCFPRVYAPIVD